MITDLLSVTKMPSTISPRVILLWGRGDLYPVAEVILSPVLWCLQNDRDCLALLGCERARKRDSERMHLIMNCRVCWTLVND